MFGPSLDYKDPVQLKSRSVPKLPFNLKEGGEPFSLAKEAHPAARHLSRREAQGEVQEHWMLIWKHSP